MTQPAQFYPWTDGWRNLGGAISLDVKLQNGKSYHVTIENGFRVPGDFAIPEDNLLELQERCAQIGNRVIGLSIDPARCAVVHSDDEGTIVVSQKGQQPFTQATEMYKDCQRICQITGSYFVALSASHINMVPPDPVPVVTTPPVRQPASSPAPSSTQPKDAVTALLDPLKHPKGPSFQEVRETPNHPLREDLKKLLLDPQDKSAEQTRRWLIGLTQHLYHSELFTEVEEEERKRLSAFWVLALLNQPKIAIGTLRDALSKAAADASSSCSVM